MNDKNQGRQRQVADWLALTVGDTHVRGTTTELTDDKWIWTSEILKVELKEHRE